jgi:HlyD family secretion protein
MRKWWLLGIGVVVVASAVFYYFNLGSKDEVAAAAAAVTTTQVRKGTIEVSVSGTGSIAADEKVSVKSPEKQGTIGLVKVTAGDKVQKGQVLATIEGEDNTDKIESAELDLEKKLLQLQSTQEQLKSATDEQNIENIKLNIDQQQLDITEARQNIADLKTAEAGSTIVAPIGGTVTAVSATNGDSLGGASDIFEIADYDHLQIVVSIDELDISQVKLGQAATVSVDAFPNKTFTGKVVDIADEGTTSNGVASFNVTISLDTIAGLKPGMTAEASIEVQKKDNVLMLPIEAVQSFGSRYMVFLPAGSGTTGQTGAGAGGQYGQSGGQAGSGSGNQSGGGTGYRTRSGGSSGNGGNQFGSGSKRSGDRNASRFGGGVPQVIQVGIHNDDYIEIVSGLTEGERVIVPTVQAAAAATNQGAGGFRAGGFGGLGGGFGGGGFGGGGFGGGQRGGNAQRSGASSGSGGSSSGGGGR